MIVSKDKTQWISDTPSEEWAEENGFYIIEDPDLANRIMYAFPEFDFVLDNNDKVVDIVTNKVKPTPELLQNKIAELKVQNQELVDCILEMSEIIYGE